ncbi:unnamed protein product, partial [Hymenolepis diminuta]
AHLLKTVFEHCDFFALSKNNFKFLPFLNCPREPCQTDVCCRLRKVIEERDGIKLEDLPNECRKLDIKCDCDTNQQKSGKHEYVNRISSKNMS